MRLQPGKHTSWCYILENIPHGNTDWKTDHRSFVLEKRPHGVTYWKIDHRSFVLEKDHMELHTGKHTTWGYIRIFHSILWK